MNQSKIIIGLTVLVALYAAFSFFLLGRQSSGRPEKEAAVAAASPPATGGPAREEPAPPPVETKVETPAVEPSVAVEVGRDGPDLDACSSSGRPRGLNPTGDDFLAVKAAPNLQARRIDKLGPSDNFYLCGTAEGGEWTSIVYDSGGGLEADCAVSSPVRGRQKYSGSCRSGWVFSKYVEVVAG